MPVSEVEKLLGSTGLAELIGRIKAAIAAAGAPPDGVTIDENDDGELEAVMDQEGGVTSFARHQADIVVDDGATTSKSGNAISVRSGGIQSTHLSNSAVTTDKIASSAVTADKLADGSVGAEQLQPGAIAKSDEFFGVVEDLAILRFDVDLSSVLADQEMNVVHIWELPSDVTKSSGLWDESGEKYTGGVQ